MSYDNELQHHGVKGMRWGHRKEDRDRYKEARRTFRQAGKDYRKNAGLGFGIKGIAKAEAAHKKYQKAEMDFVSEKVKYKTSNAKDMRKAELKAYTKEMYKTGLPGSVADKTGRSKALYSRIKAEKGKKFADEVLQRTQNRAVTTMVTSAAVGIGAMVVSAMLESQ